MGIGFSRAGVEHQGDLVAVRPKQRMGRNEEMWIDGVDEDGDEVVDLGDEDMDGEAGKRVVRKLLDPILPSQAEVREHELTHLPYRNWCPHCIKGKGKEMGHHRKSRDEEGLAEYHLDYCFPGDDIGFQGHDSGWSGEAFGDEDVTGRAYEGVVRRVCGEESH